MSRYLKISILVLVLVALCPTTHAQGPAGQVPTCGSLYGYIQKNLPAPERVVVNARVDVRRITSSEIMANRLIFVSQPAHRLHQTEVEFLVDWVRSGGCVWLDLSTDDDGSYLHGEFGIKVTSFVPGGHRIEARPAGPHPVLSGVGSVMVYQGGWGKKLSKRERERTFGEFSGLDADLLQYQGKTIAGIKSFGSGLVICTNGAFRTYLSFDPIQVRRDYDRNSDSQRFHLNLMLYAYDALGPAFEHYGFEGFPGEAAYESLRDEEESLQRRCSHCNILWPPSYSFCPYDGEQTLAVRPGTAGYGGGESDSDHGEGADGRKNGNSSVDLHVVVTTSVLSVFSLTRHDLVVSISGPISRSMTETSVPTATPRAFLFAGIPEGNYELVATYGDRSIRKTVHVTGATYEFQMVF